MGVSIEHLYREGVKCKSLIRIENIEKVLATLEMGVIWNYKQLQL